MSQTPAPAGSEDPVCTPAASTHVAAGRLMTPPRDDGGKTSPKCIQWKKQCATVYAVCYAISWDKEGRDYKALPPFAYICTQ